MSRAIIQVISTNLFKNFRYRFTLKIISARTSSLLAKEWRSVTIVEMCWLWNASNLKRLEDQWCRYHLWWIILYATWLGKSLTLLWIIIGSVVSKKEVASYLKKIKWSWPSTEKNQTSFSCRRKALHLPSAVKAVYSELNLTTVSTETTWMAIFLCSVLIFAYLSCCRCMSSRTTINLVWW